MGCGHGRRGGARLITNTHHTRLGPQADVINRGFGGYFTNWFKDYMLDSVGRLAHRAAPLPAAPRARGACPPVVHRARPARRRVCAARPDVCAAVRGGQPSSLPPTPTPLQLFNVTAPLMGIVFLGTKDSQLSWAAG